MLKDIDWLKEQLGLIDLRWGEDKGSEFFRGFSAALDITKNLVNQMDDPKLPVIPQFVADYIESKKKKGEKFARVMLDFHNNSIEYSINEYIDNNYETFAMAWLLEDCAIEKELKMLYEVKLPTANNMAEMMNLVQGTNLNHFWFTVLDGQVLKYKFTEQEIKEIDERYWVLAEEATGQ